MAKLFFAVAAVTSAGLYSGAAVYMSVVQHPAILRLGSRRLQAPFFCQMYVSASAFLAPIGLVASTASFAAWTVDTAISTSNPSALWIVGGSIFLALVPYTTLAMLRLNLHLTDERYWKTHRTAFMQAKLHHWGVLHALRSIASVVATATLVCACLRQGSWASLY